MTSQESIDVLNDELRRRGNPYWWIDTRLVHPARQVRVPMTRAPKAETMAKQFFAETAKDPELLVRRLNLLWEWARQSRILERSGRRRPALRLHLDWPV